VTYSLTDTYLYSVQKKSILVIIPYYAPEQHPRPHRWSHICAHWAAQGHDIEVITSRYADCPAAENLKGVRVSRVGYAGIKGYLNRKASFGSRSSTVNTHSLMNQLRFFFLQRVIRPWLFPDEFHWLFGYKAKHYAFSRCNEKTFDLVITVSKPFSTHLIGMAIKAKYPNLLWFTDHGDPFSLLPTLPFAAIFQKRARSLEQRVYQLSDAFFVTNERLKARYIEMLGPKHEVIVLPPILGSGFDSALHTDRSEAQPIRLDYFGALYEPERSGDLLIEFCRALQNINAQFAQKIEVRLFGQVQIGIAQAFSELPMVKLMGEIERTQVPIQMKGSSVLLNIGNSVDYLLPSKSVEYLAAGRPILHLTALPHDAFTDLMGQAAVVGRQSSVNNSQLLTVIGQQSSLVGQSELAGEYTHSKDHRKGRRADMRFAEGDMKCAIDFITKAAKTGTQMIDKEHLKQFSTDTVAGAILMNLEKKEQALHKK
jgi:hypothetical protein